VRFHRLSRHSPPTQRNEHRAPKSFDAGNPHRETQPRRYTNGKLHAGVPDFVLYNTENGGFGVSRQNVVVLQKLNPDGSPSGSGVIKFYTDADLNSSNAIFTVLLADLGVTADTTLNLSVYAFDNYFTGNLTDAIEAMVYTPSKPRFAASDLPDAGIAPHAKVKLKVTAPAGGAAASPSQTGLLLQYRDSDVRNESQAVVVKP